MGFLWIFLILGRIITLDFFDFWQIICLDNFFFVSLHPDRGYKANLISTIVDVV
jgi:hypothetical protein